MTLKLPLLQMFDTSHLLFYSEQEKISSKNSLLSDIDYFNVWKMFSHLHLWEAHMLEERPDVYFTLAYIYIE